MLVAWKKSRPTAPVVVGTGPRPRLRPKSRDPFVQGSSSDRRRAHRRTGMAVKVLVQEPEAPQTQSEAWIVDRSIMGLGLDAPWSCDPGTRLEIRPAAGDCPWIAVVVKNCRRVQGQFRVGCEYVTVPPASVLMMFG
jgi:hypothetical protein